MKKIIMLFLVSGIMIAVSGCATKYTTDITFDQFTFPVITENTKLEEISQEQKEIFAKEENLYKIYTIMNKSGFSESLLISKEQSLTEIPLERVMQINIKKLENRLQGFDASSASQINIKCKDNTSITGYFQSWTFDSVTPNKTIYMNQYFFKNQDYLYIISSSTENSTNNKGFKNGIKNIQCL